MTISRQSQSAGIHTVTSDVARWLGDENSNRVALGHSFCATTERSLNPHEHIVLDGDEQTHLYQVLSGVVGIYKLMADGRRQIVSFQYPGDIVGLDRIDQFDYHAEALCASRVRCIPVQAISSLVNNEPGFGAAMLRLLADELAETREQLVSLGRKSALEKLATFLLQIASRNRRAGRDANVLQLPMSRSEIADYLGLTIETVSRNVTRLKKSGAIALEKTTRVRVLDAQQLQLIADGDTDE